MYHESLIPTQKPNPVYFFSTGLYRFDYMNGVVSGTVISAGTENVKIRLATADKVICMTMDEFLDANPEKI